MQTTTSHAVSLNMQPYDGKEHDRPLCPYSRENADPPPKDFVLWSLFSFSFLNACCLGFAALVFSIKSRDRKVIGDPEGAATYGKQAKRLNIAALILSIIYIVIVIVIVIKGAEMYQLPLNQMKNRH
ncbi:dispanin subfamily A member 2b-like [Rhineura floridana]|uniref:dispanin subfamily A member 2b-like n=1 Tax=Rhineura floridana TaxID=261503 RepID=UPI002AC89174|nr:dispanin subfamily A member 2b-like [Rhineura floridana]